MKRVIIESPYAGDVALNLRYLRACMRDCLLRGEAPYASHGLYTQEGVLKDEIPAEREHGIQAGFAWRTVAEMTVVYTDLGVSHGMYLGMKHAQENGHTVELRKLDGWVMTDCACCDGEGRVGPWGDLEVIEPCPVCHGRGEV